MPLPNPTSMAKAPRWAIDMLSGWLRLVELPWLDIRR
jgi:hypothetical protein